MTDPNKIYYPQEITDQPLAGDVAAFNLASNVKLSEILSSPTMADQGLGASQAATILVSTSLNTLSNRILASFSFSAMGAIQIGSYVGGVSGDIKISPNGIVARNNAGVTTFALDATTGDATFKGTVLAGSVITGYLQVGEAAGDVNSGSVTIGGGKITANSIAADRMVTGALVVGTNVGLGTAQDASQVTSIVGGVVTTGFVNALGITAGSVAAENITGTYITGKMFRTASSGNRIEIDANLYSGQAAIHLINSNGDFYIYNNNGNLDLEGSDVFVESSLRVNNTVYSESGDLVLNPQGSNKVKIGGNLNANGKKIESADTISCAKITSSSDRIELNNGSQYFRMADYNMASDNDGSGRARLQWSNGSVFKIDASGSWFQINGNSKSAIVPTSQGYNALYCIEAPEVWFMDFCQDKDHVANLFTEITEGEMHFIKCENGEFQVWRRRKGHADKRFEHKTMEEFSKNEKFLAMARV